MSSITTMPTNLYLKKGGVAMGITGRLPSYHSGTISETLGFALQFVLSSLWNHTTYGVAVVWNCDGEGMLQNLSHGVAHAVAAQKIDGIFVLPI